MIDGWTIIHQRPENAMQRKSTPDQVAAKSASARKRAHTRGIRAEWKAEAFLRMKGYRILARRYNAPGGEIDLIARRGGAIAFVEVKHRATIDAARNSVTHQKRQRITRAVRHWLTKNPSAMQLTLRADAVFLAPRRWPAHEENLFELSV